MKISGNGPKIEETNKSMRKHINLKVFEKTGNGSKK